MKRAGDVMAPAPPTLAQDVPISEAVQLMATGAKVAPVEDDAGALIGMLDRADGSRASFGAADLGLA